MKFVWKNMMMLQGYIREYFTNERQDYCSKKIE